MEDDGFRVVNSCHGGPRPAGNRPGLRVPQEEGTANSVPAAAVRQRSQALFGFIGRKGRVGGPGQVGGESSGLNPGRAPDTAGLFWRPGEEIGIHGVAVKCVELVRKTGGASGSLDSA